jgi:hypothetical protein
MVVHDLGIQDIVAFDAITMGIVHSPSSRVELCVLQLKHQVISLLLLLLQENRGSAPAVLAFKGNDQAPGGLPGDSRLSPLLLHPPQSVCSNKTVHPLKLVSTFSKRHSTFPPLVASRGPS